LAIFALTHPEHGTHFVYSEEAVEEHRKLGWKLRPADWKERARAENEARKRAAMKAEMERLAAELGELAPEVPKRKYTRKAA
jgi:hypothetical protein